MNYETVDSNKGKPLIKFNDYLYRKRSTRGPISYYCCVYENCSSRGKLLDGKFEANSDHNHSPDLTDLISRNQRMKIKQLIKSDPTKSGLEIYNQATMEVIDSTEFREELLGVSLQPFITLQPTISYSKLKLLPPLPTCRADIKISQSFAELENGSKFLFVDDGNEDKMLIFATEEFFQFLCNSDKVYMDGTFRTVPKLFYQLYTMHIMINDLMIPVVYALLPNKQCDTYLRLFRHLQDAALQRGTVFSPDAFVIDFESGAISAIKGLFANSRIKCCRFHFAQCIWRKAQKLGLKSVYNEEEGKTKAIQRLMALPLVRPEHIDELFEHILSSIRSKLNRKSSKQSFYYKILALKWFENEEKDWCKLKGNND